MLVKVLLELTDEAGEAYLQAHRELEEQQRRTPR